ncbi:catalase family peroxidase [Neisseriaceae bacterium TC5R-5]|nr:catalase family peroxidase [Neisseriaceae bacterium TC5R-5]
MKKNIPSTFGQLGRLSLIALIVGSLAGAFAYAANWIGPAKLTPQRMINTMEADAGPHPGFRKAHGKGLCFIGQFESNGKASSLSKAMIFTAGSTSLIGRFSLGSGDPYALDSSALVRGMGLYLKDAGGSEWRMAMNTPPILDVATPEARYEKMLATQPDPATGKPDPAKLQAFFDAHPETEPFRQWQKSYRPSNSFANTSFHSINAFRFVNSAGESHYVRWAMQAETPYQPMDKNDTDPDFLKKDLAQRLQQGALRWRLMLTVAETGDITDDSTLAWPNSRRQIDAGTLVISQIDEGQQVCKNLNFDPLILPPGIAPSADPILSARSAAYSESFNRRMREGVPVSTAKVAP